MPKKKDLTGQRFGRLVVIGDSGKRKRNGDILWLCKCKCGNKILVRTWQLTSGQTLSCKCLRAEGMKKGAKIYREEMNEKQKKNRLETLDKGRVEDLKENTKISSLDQKISKRNSSGTKGVYWNKQQKKWIASIMFKNKYIYLGVFKNKKDAINAREEAEEKYFKPILDKYKKD